MSGVRVPLPLIQNYKLGSIIGQNAKDCKSLDDGSSPFLAFQKKFSGRSAVGSASVLGTEGRVFKSRSPEKTLMVKSGKHGSFKIYYLLKVCWFESN